MSTQISSPVSSNSSETLHSETLLDYPQIKKLVETLTHYKFYSRSHIYSMMTEGRFPKAIKISRLSAWRKSEVLAWLRERGVSVPSDVE